MDNNLECLKGGMIVSCQAEGSDPFNAKPEYMALFAQAAVMGGAIGIRTEGVEKVMAIKRVVAVPVIGLLKSSFEDGTVKITGSYDEVEALIEAGSDIIAIDGTFREREGLTGPDFIKKVKEKYGCLVLADVAELEEGLACEQSGADGISTTLNGYTPNTFKDEIKGPNLRLLNDIVHHVNIPVFAEGRYNAPFDAKKAMETGAYAVISGTAITRPRVITRWFVEAIKNKNNENTNKSR